MAEPEFEGLSTTEVRELIDGELARCMDPRWRDEWWDAQFDDKTPSQMLAASEYRKLWCLAEVMCDPGPRDITEILQMRD